MSTNPVAQNQPPYARASGESGRPEGDGRARSQAEVAGPIPAGVHPYIPICADFDSECVEVRCKVTCWMYAPERGRCPYLERNVE